MQKDKESARKEKNQWSFKILHKKWILQKKKKYKKVKDLPKKELKERRELVKLRVQKHCLSKKQLLESSEYNISVASTSPLPTLSLFLIAMKFLKGGESLKKTANLQKEKRALSKSEATLQRRVHRIKKTKQITEINQLVAPQRSFTDFFRKDGLSPRRSSDKDVFTVWWGQRSEHLSLN